MTENNYDELEDAICELVNIAEDATSREEFEILDNAGVDVIDCLDKLRGYEAIGTIEEFKALKEKAEPKKPKEISWGATNCSICGQEFGFNSHFNHCSNCGQKLDWSE